jgi:hypothetical protein
VAYSAQVIADSVSSKGVRLTTMVVEFPRCMLSEFNTHRVFSRNSASSRAIPVFKQLRKIMVEPFIPSEFGVNKPKMQAGEPLTGAQHENAVAVWLEARDNAVFQVLKLMTSDAYIEEGWTAWSDTSDDFTAFVLKVCEDVEAKNPEIFEREDLLAVHKGLANRLLEPFMWHTVIVTATEWDNFFALRTSTDAQLEIRLVAYEMEKAYAASQPMLLSEGEWHLPFLQENERQWARENPEEACKAVAARCARVSYLTHDTGTVDLGKDLALANDLASRGHMSPFEHVATPLKHRRFTKKSGNLRGWQPFRKTLKHEDDYGKVVAKAA